MVNVASVFLIIYLLLYFILIYNQMIFRISCNTIIMTMIYKKADLTQKKKRERLVTKSLLLSILNAQTKNNNPFE